MASSVILLGSWSLERRYAGVSSKHSSRGRTSAVRPIFRIAQDRTKLLITCTSSYPGRDRQNQKMMPNWASLPETRLDVDVVEALKVSTNVGPAKVSSACFEGNYSFGHVGRRDWATMRSSFSAMSATR